MHARSTATVATGGRSGGAAEAVPNTN